LCVLLLLSLSMCARRLPLSECRCVCASVDACALLEAVTSHHASAEGYK